MQIITKFNKGDTAFLLVDRKCYKAVIKKISSITGEEWTEIKYIVDKKIPQGLLKTETEEKVVEENKLFATQDEVKYKLSSIEKAEKLIKENPNPERRPTPYYHMDGNGYATSYGVNFPTYTITT